MSDVAIEITEVAVPPIEVTEAEGAPPVLVEVPPAVEVIEVAVPGPQGEPGPPGPQGPPGAGDAHFVYIQNSASEVWGPINHNLGKFPAVGVKDSGGTEMDAGVEHIDENSLRIHFATPTSGVAYFN